MLRAYIAPVIGTGTLQDPQRLKVAVYGVDYRATIPTYPDGHAQEGRPVTTWGFAFVDAADHSALLADAELQPFPFILPGAELSLLQRLALRSKLQALGADDSGIVAGITLRQAVRFIARQLNPQFDEAVEAGW